MVRNYAHVASHDLNAGKLAGKSARVIQYKALGTDCRPDLAVRRALDFEHCLVAYVELLSLYAAGENVDRRRTEEFCHKEVHRVVIHALRLADLLYDALFHDHYHIRDAHRLFLVMCYEHRGYFCFTLDAAYLLARLESQSRVKV